MTRDETKKILMMIQAAFPNFKPPDKTVAVNTWFLMLKDVEYSTVETALRVYITTDTSGFAPSIGQLLDKLHAIQRPQELNEMEAWSLVSKALRNGYYGANEEFRKLPTLVQKALGSPQQLRIWASDEKYNESVVSSNFMRAYRFEIKRMSDRQKIPPEILGLIDSVNEESKMKLRECDKEIIGLEVEENKTNNQEGVPMPQWFKERVGLKK